MATKTDVFNIGLGNRTSFEVKERRIKTLLLLAIDLLLVSGRPTIGMANESNVSVVVVAMTRPLNMHIRPIMYALRTAVL